MITPPLLIAIPAWSPPYVELAVKYTIPAIIRSLAISPFDDVQFLIHTDDPWAFKGTMDGLRVRTQAPVLDKGQWEAFSRAHREAIAATPEGGIVALFNADIVCSIETFSVVAYKLQNASVVASIGTRTAVDRAEPPIGVSGDELARWIWSNRHPITEELIWGKGRSTHPTVLYFDDREGNVAFNAFHMTPMFIKVDRPLDFEGTIDDDLIEKFASHEVCYLAGGQAIFAELSRDTKPSFTGDPLSVDGVVQFDRNRRPLGMGFTKAHCQNFSRTMRLMGYPVEHGAVGDILSQVRS